MAASENEDYKQALKLQEAGRHDEAEEKYRAAMAALPGDVTVVFRLACLLTGELSRHEEAEVHFRKAIELDPNHLNSHFCLADLLACHLGRCEEAETYYREALRINPRNLNTHFNLGALLTAELGRHMEAEGHYRAALCIDPKDADSHFNLAELLKDYLNRPAEAMEHYRMALDIDPDDKQVHCNLGKLLTEHMGKHEEAEQSFLEALRIDPEYVDAHVNIGLLLTEMLDKHLVAEVHFRKALDITPDCLDTLFNLSELLTEHTSKYEEAEELYKRAIGLSPEDFDSRFNLGCLQTNHLGKHEEAESHLQVALELDPDDVRVKKALVSVLREHLDRGDEADELAAALTEEPVVARLQQKDDTIQRLQGELDASKQETQLLKNRKTELAGQLKDANKELSTAQKQMYMLKDKVGKLEADTASKSSIRERQLQVHIKELMAELTASQKEQLQLECDKENLEMMLEKAKFAAGKESPQREAGLEAKVQELQDKVSGVNQELQASKSAALEHATTAREATKVIEERNAEIATLREIVSDSAEGTPLEKELVAELEIMTAMEAEARREAEGFKVRVSELSGEVDVQNALMDELLQAASNAEQAQAELEELKHKMEAMKAVAPREQGDGARSSGLKAPSGITKPQSRAGGRRRTESNAGQQPSGRRRADTSGDSNLPSYMRPTGRTRDPPRELTSPSYMRSTASRGSPKTAPSPSPSPSANGRPRSLKAIGSPAGGGDSQQVAELTAELNRLRTQLKQAQQVEAPVEAPGSSAVSKPAVELAKGVKACKQQLEQVKTEVSKEQKQALGEVKKICGTIAKAFSQCSKLGVAAAGEAAAECTELRDLYRRECKKRKKLYNELQEIRGNLRVYCRVRPMAAEEAAVMGERELIEMDPELGVVRVKDEGNKVGKRSFEFDQVYDAATHQEALFVDVDPLITSILDGYNVCIFAYGQTGSGKTHTMVGPAQDPGVSLRAVDALFREVSERAQETVEFFIMMFEVYNDEIYDLLETNSSKKLTITQDRDCLLYTSPSPRDS
eukprot:TRINITY_DN3247_c0_g1_i2.p1 TRINITY_DN3247_c0_g1~~TRINITY_DN3247_c0_g1_i2.p1  ORF type:complete len:1029 (-),score=344.59 TRINITY_DN3247_c0_g1_i2:147-3233(-)